MADTNQRRSNKDRMKEITEQLERGIREVFESGQYAEYLSVMSRFHTYSARNQVLIHMQRPDATLLAGFNKWKNQFSRHVKRGERGITIIAPTPFKKKIEEMKLKPARYHHLHTSRMDNILLLIHYAAVPPHPFPPVRWTA